jgi:hypothetical protein
MFLVFTGDKSTALHILNLSNLVPWLQQPCWSLYSRLRRTQSQFGSSSKVNHLFLLPRNQTLEIQTIFAIIFRIRQYELLKADSHIACHAHAVPLQCRAPKGLECVFPIWFTQCGCVWFTLAMPCRCHAHAVPMPCSDHAVLPFGFFWLPRGVPWRLLSEAYQSSPQRSIPTTLRVVAAHYKKDDLLNCWTSSSDTSGYHADFHEQHGTVGAWQGHSMTGEWHGHSMLCVNRPLNYHPNNTR